ncbi:MAG: hypothetical protein K2M76_00560, partial [Muribaculaceae bacterium]|nr:hypothetical protein [Muribaculaceae bacterium]
LILSGLLALLCSSCSLEWVAETLEPPEACTDAVAIVNASDKTIYICDGVSPLDDEPSQRSPYVVFNHFPSGMTKVEPGASYNYMHVVYGGMIKYKLYHILIINESTMAGSSSAELVENNVYDYWYKLTLTDLRRKDFVITYTGE